MRTCELRTPSVGSDEEATEGLNRFPRWKGRVEITEAVDVAGGRGVDQVRELIKSGRARLVATVFPWGVDFELESLETEGWAQPEAGAAG